MRMIDISKKGDTAREAEATGKVLLSGQTLRMIRENTLPKGDVLACAKVAGILAAKRTPELIPLTHNIPLTHVEVTLEVEERGVVIHSLVKSLGKTGPEMEALTAVSVAALTVHDMCKGIDFAIRITGISILRKSGGKSGEVSLYSTHLQNGTDPT